MQECELLGQPLFICVLPLQWSMPRLTGTTLLSWKPLPFGRMNQVRLLLHDYKSQMLLLLLLLYVMHNRYKY